MGGDNDNILFAKFEILECLKKDVGAGVYIANHIYLGKKILLKTLDRDNIPDPAMLSRFQREAKTLARLDHPNIIKVLDFGTYDQFFYISFEYFKSRNLRAVINAGDLTVEQKRAAFVQLLCGLDFAHQHNVVHRDIKPENILVDESNFLKIADFGLAHIHGQESLTQQTSIVGTPSYMSPEQTRGEELTAQSDLFSTGVVAYELFRGVNPFLGHDVGATLNNILSSKVEVDETVCQSDVIQDVIRSLLCKNRNERSKSARSALDFLGESTSEEKSQAESPPVLFQKKSLKKRYGLWISLLVLFIVATWSIFTLLHKMQQTTTTEPEAADTEIEKNIDSTKIKNSGNADSLQTEIYAPEEEKIESAVDRKKPDTPGALFIKCRPWAEVFIDSQKIDTTPLDDAVLLSPGEHQLRLEHPNFPVYVQNIRIEAEKELSLSIVLFSYLTCNIYPWGEVYLNGTHIGQTPFAETVIIAPGQHVLTVKNQQYGEVDKEFNVSRGDTFHFSLNFAQHRETSKPRLDNK